MRNSLKLLVCLVSLSLMGFTTARAQENDSIQVVIPGMDYQIPKRYVLEDVQVTGLQYLSPELIIGSAGLIKGDSIYLPSDYITNILSELWGHKYYSNVRAEVELEGDKAYLEIILKERPRVSTWNFNGIKKSEDTDLREKLALKKRTELSEFTMDNSLRLIKEYLDEKGYRNAEIEVLQKQDPMLDNFIIVTFDIDKKEKVKIQEIFIEGNNLLEEKQLKKAMKKTRENTLANFFKSSKLNDSDFANDKILLEDYLQSKGFRDGVVLSDSIYKISDERIGIVVTINEGDKYHYRNINWVGNEKYTQDQLNMLLGIAKGDVYDRKTMEAQLGLGSEGFMAAYQGQTNVSTVYRNNGYLASQFEPSEKVVSGDSIDVDIKILEGRQFTINNVSISGNDRTNDRVIRREIYVRPGEMYDQSMLYYSMRQLGNMGHFVPENVFPDISPVSDQLVDIAFNLEEQPSDEIEVSGGWGSSMFVASAAISLNNISMRNFFKGEEWRPYPTGDNQTLSFSLQYSGSYYQAATLSFLEPWLGGRKPNSLYVSLYYSSQNTGSAWGSYYVDTGSSSEFLTTGIAVGLGKRLTWPDPNFTLYGELSYQAYDLTDWSGFVFTDGVSNTVALSVTLGRNSTDQQLYPRSGSEISIKGTVTPPWSLMNNIDYSDSDLSDQDRYRWIEYYKINAMGRFFVPMLKTRDLVFMARAEFGYLGEYNINNPSPFEGFSVGGDGISGYDLYGLEYIGLRGYADYALTPYASSGTQARAYVKYTAEVRYPISLSSQSSIYVLTFAEAGNAFYDFKTLNPFDVRKSLGVGARMYLPVVGSFGIDWGYGFNSVPGSSVASGSQYHFSIGQTF